MLLQKNLPTRRPSRNENLNESIRAREVRTVFPDGTTEILTTATALLRARSLGLDLVLVVPGAAPPVAKVIDYRRHLFDEKKKQQAAKKKQHVVQVKELKFRVPLRNCTGEILVG
jgi:translation initiation factor IF-3